MRRVAKHNPREAIPEESRRLVGDRDVRCARDGVALGTDWHHRRRRNVRDGHEHCPCNGVMLCRTCHSWAHANPAAALAKGWMVPTHREPWRTPQWRPDGWWLCLHDGSMLSLTALEVVSDPLGLPTLSEEFNLSRTT